MTTKTYKYTIPDLIANDSVQLYRHDDNGTRKLIASGRVIVTYPNQPVICTDNGKRMNLWASDTFEVVKISNNAQPVSQAKPIALLPKYSGPRSGYCYTGTIDGGFCEVPKTRKGWLKELARLNDNINGTKPRTIIPSFGKVIALPPVTGNQLLIPAHAGAPICPCGKVITTWIPSVVAKPTLCISCDLKQHGVYPPEQTPASNAIQYQPDLFGNTAQNSIQHGLFGDTPDKIVKPKKVKGEKPTQTAMFADRETIQFGVTKATPLMPIPQDCKISLALVSEDPRTAEQIAADTQRQAEANTAPLFTDTDNPGVPSDTTDWCAYLPTDHKSYYRAQGDSWNGLVLPDECTYYLPGTEPARPKSEHVSLGKLSTRPYAKIERLTLEHGTANGYDIPIQRGGPYIDQIKWLLTPDMMKALQWLIDAKQIRVDSIDDSLVHYVYTDEA